MLLILFPVESPGLQGKKTALGVLNLLPYGEISFGGLVMMCSTSTRAEKESDRSLVSI